MTTLKRLELSEILAEAERLRKEKYTELPAKLVETIIRTEAAALGSDSAAALRTLEDALQDLVGGS